jgi:ATP-dependent Lon protease
MENQEIIKLPAIALRGLVAFPNNALTFDVGREKSKNAIIKAIEQGQKIYLVGQKDFDSEDPSEKNLYSVGVVAELSQTMKIKDGNIRVVAGGLYRAKTVEMVNKENHFEALVTPYPEKAVRLKDRTEADAVIRTIGTLIAEYNEASPGLPKEVIMKIMTSDDIKFLSEYIPSHLFLRFDDKQRVLEENNALTRLCMLCEILDREINVLDLENEILDKVRTNLDKNQKDYMLREQMQVIAKELGNDDNPLEEGARFEAAVKALSLTEASEKKLLDEVKKFSKMPPASHEASVLRSYIEYVLSLPFGKKTKEKTDTLAAERILNRDHYGLSKVK